MTYGDAEGFDLEILFGEDNNYSDLLNYGDQFCLHQDAPLLEETIQSKNEVPGSEVESECNTARDKQIQISGSKNINESTVIAQYVQSTDTNSELDAASHDKRSKKRKIDRAYRERQKAIKQKQEEELQILRQENLQLKLEAAKQKEDKIKGKDADQKNDAEECRIEFELDFADEVAKRKLMMIAGGFPGITSIKMDKQRQRMILEGINIDPLPLRDELKRICNTRLVLFRITETKKKEKKDAKKLDMGKKFEEKMDMDEPHCYRITYPHPEEPPPFLYAQDFAESYGATAMPRFNFKNSATLFLTVLLLLLLTPDAVYSDVLIRLMIFFNAIGHGIRSAQKLICDIFDLLRT